jgi:hypothetical protein
MESVLYNIIEYGIDPCTLKLVSLSWNKEISRIDEIVRQRIQWRFPNKSIEFIVMLLIDCLDMKSIRICLFHMSIPIVDWNIVSYLVDNIQVGTLIHQRVKSIHTKEMARRIGIPISIPDKEIFKMYGTVNSTSSTGNIKCLTNIIKSGYLDAYKILVDAAKDKNHIMSLTYAAIHWISKDEELFNPCVLRYILKSEKIEIDSASIMISLDISLSGIDITVPILHRLGKNLLNSITKNRRCCRLYINECFEKKVVPNIRVINAIISNCTSPDIVRLASDIATKMKWTVYMPGI